ncbi:hypothetical protein FACS189449_09120 [Alphaproteobacteria bacterium]|nr:hypothetical protein FACS189449_09120 [Alphaproteobacteria bacterium]
MWAFHIRKFRTLELERQHNGCLSKLINITKNEENIAYNRRCLEENSIKVPEDIFAKYLEEIRNGNPNASTDAQIDDYPTSPEVAAGRLFKNTMEVLQIMGLGVWEKDGKKVLCINLLSDFAISRELGEPIRCGHGCGDPSQFTSKLSPHFYRYDELVKYSKNTEVFDALTRVYDALSIISNSSIEEHEDVLNRYTFL